MFEGNVIEVSQFSHGMHADNNVLTLSGIQPNTIPTTITAALGLNDSSISVADTTGFNFQNGIHTTSGFAQINGEIIYYSSVTAGTSPAGTLGIGSRGVDSIQQAHLVNTQIFPYELNGVSLNRINTTHNMTSNTLLKSESDLDRYHLQILRGDFDDGDDQLSFSDENQVGGPNCKGTRNIQYNSIVPAFNVITPGEGSTVSGQIRTVSGTSAGGSEISFLDQGFEDVSLNNPNNLTTPRIIASERNETTRLLSLPKNKSLTVGLTLTSDDPNLSPMINVVNQTGIILQRNRLNNPISNYAFDGRVNLEEDDPHTSTYVSNMVSLKQPATSLKVLVGSYRHSSADFRVLYKLSRTDSSGVEQTFELFPGHDNLKDGEIIDVKNNSGRSDIPVRSSAEGEFNEYEFSVDELEQFTGFQIKIVMSGTNEARAPKFKDLRVIALA